LYDIRQGIAGEADTVVIKHQDLLDHEPTMEASELCRVYTMQTKLQQTIYGFYFANPKAQYTILYVHGNAMDCAALFAFWRELSEQVGANILALEYSGYGASTGEASVNNTIADIEAAYDLLTDQLQTPSERIVLYGQSVGSGPVCNLAARRPIGGVVLHCALMTGLQTIFGPPTCCSPSCTFAACDIYKNIDLVEKINAPVFVIHGDEDDVIRRTHGESLYLNSSQKYDPYFVPGANHNDVVEVNPHEYYNRIAAFLLALSDSTVGGSAPRVTSEMKTDENPASAHTLDVSAPGTNPGV